MYDKQIIYEAEHFYKFSLSIPFIVICIIDVIIIFLLARFVVKNGIHNAKYEILFFGFIIAVLSLIIGSLIYCHIDAKHKVYDQYLKGNYSTVEGYIENYTPDPDGARLPDRFNINDIDFSVPGYVSCWGYPLRKVDGGILENGMKVKICYIHYKYENVIMKIELIE